jgi:serine/threonine-protein kinase
MDRGDEGRTRRRSRRGPSWIGIFLVALVTSCVVVGAHTWVLVSRGILRLETARTQSVPSLLGMPKDAASTLAQHKALRLVIKGEEAHDTVPRGAIVSQEPSPGSSAPADASVRVMVSSGAAQLMLPNLEGQPVEQALATLEDLKLARGPILGPSQGDRIVKSTTPGPGTRLSRGDMVGFVVEVPAVTVPKLVGLSWTKAEPLLHAAGLKTGTVKEIYDSDYGGWIVLKQSLAPGATTAPGSAVDIVVNERD